MKLTFHGGTQEGRVYDSPSVPDRFDWPFWGSDSAGNFCQGVERYVRRGKSKSFDFLEKIEARALPEVEEKAFLTKAQLHRLKCRLARDKERADKIAKQLGLTTVEEQEKLNEIADADKAIAELKAQMEELDRLAVKP